MKLSPRLYSKSASSSRWLTRQQSDPFVRARQGAPGSSSSEDVASCRSRSSFKLVSMAKKYKKLIERGGVVVDLGAAPGGWSQVASSLIGPKGLVIGLDLLPIAPLNTSTTNNVTFIQGDFLSSKVQEELYVVLAEKSSNHRKTVAAHDLAFSKDDNKPHVDTVLSDMMANMSGVRVRDVENSLMLCEMGLEFAEKVLRRGVNVEVADSGESLEGTEGGVNPVLSKIGGSLVLKHFAHPLLTAFRKERLNPVFEKVYYEKPKESRSESSEGYFVCLGYKGRGFPT